MKAMRAACLAATLLGVVLLVVPEIPRAEVSVDSPGPGSRAGFVLMTGGDDGSGPAPWTRRRLHVPAWWVLNPDGDTNGDGFPAFAITPGSGEPQVCWARFDGADTDIVLSRWTGTDWSAPLPVTDDDEDDLDPALAIGPDGTRHVTWWKPGDNRVRYVAVGPGESVPEPELVTQPPREGSRPGVALFAGAPWVAWQVDVDDHVEVRVSRRLGPGDWSAARTVGTATWAGPEGDGALDVRIHAPGGHLWVDWVDDPGVLAWSEYDPEGDAWSPEQHESYDWDEAAGISERDAREMARASLRRRILSR